MVTDADASGAYKIKSGRLNFFVASVFVAVANVKLHVNVAYIGKLSDGTLARPFRSLRQAQAHLIQMKGRETMGGWGHCVNRTFDARPRCPVIRCLDRDGRGRPPSVQRRHSCPGKQVY